MPITPKTFWPQVWRGKSMVRAFMNAELAALEPSAGRILDIGGTNVPRPTYRNFLRLKEGAIVITLNTDPDAKPDLLGDASAIPSSDSSFDEAWCFNLLEHVADPAAVVREAFRVLKPGARFVSFTPFFVRIHGHPSDYGRYTDASFRRFADLAGFSVLTIKPVGAGPFVAAAAQIQVVFPRFLFLPVAAAAFWLDALLLRWRPAFRCAWPLGYLAIYGKPETENYADAHHRG